MSTENPSQADVDATLRNIESLVEQIGDQVVEPIREDTDDGPVIHGRQVQHGSHQFQVLAAQEWEFIRLQSQFNAVQAVALDRAVSSNPGNGQPVQISADMIKEVRDDVREAADEDLQEIRQGVIDRISEPGYGANIDAEGPFVTGFAVTKKLFPYEESLTASEFEEAAQGVVSLMYRGKSYLITKYGLQDLSSGGQATDGPRGFQ